MKENQVATGFRKAAFPCCMAVLSFVCFIVLYAVVIAIPFKDFHLQGLMFVIPFFCFVTITIFALSGKLNAKTSAIVTIAAICVSLVLSTFLLFYLLFQSAERNTTDCKEYERALSLAGYPRNQAVNFFPQGIPEQAQDAKFSYQSSFGGEKLSLLYRVKVDAIQSVRRGYASRATWVGELAQLDAKESGIMSESFAALEDASGNLPKDLTIYLMYSKPYKPNDWNHGETGFVAVSEQNSRILYSYADW